VRGRCVVLSGPTLFWRPTGRDATHPPRPMTRGPGRRRDGLREALPGGTSCGGVDRSWRPDGTGHAVTIAFATLYARCGRVSIWNLETLAGGSHGTGGTVTVAVSVSSLLSCSFCQPRDTRQDQAPGRQQVKNVLGLVFLCAPCNDASTEWYVLRSIIISPVLNVRPFRTGSLFQFGLVCLKTSYVLKVPAGRNFILLAEGVGGRSFLFSLPCLFTMESISSTGHYKGTKSSLDHWCL
jgi:hypothetical protein